MQIRRRRRPLRCPRGGFGHDAPTRILNVSKITLAAGVFGRAADKYGVDHQSSSSLADVSRPPRPGAGSIALTYEPFYRLREKPFSLSADPRFLFKSPAHAPAFDALLVGISRREGLTVLTGEIGSGKTMVCRSVLQQLDHRTFAAFVPDPFVSREDLLKTLLVEFGVVSISDLKAGLNRASRLDLSYLLYEFLDSLVPLQAFAVLIIDEAQNLTLPLLEEIRILSELERREKLLQVVLVGQPELRANLKLPQMRQVDQRVSVRHELRALDAADVAAYVQHRLHVASEGESCVQFPADSLTAIYQASSGVPRVINHICDRALQRAYVSRAFRIEPHFVRDAIGDLGLCTGRTTATVALVAPSAAAPAAAAVNAPQQTLPSTEVLLSPAPPDDAPDLQEFTSESAPAVARTQSTRRESRRTWWVPTAAALAATGAVATAGIFYLRADTVDARAIAAMVPAPPAMRLRQDATRRLPDDESVAAGATTQASSTAATTGEEYLIQVAWFASRGRAERLVAELTTAGYRARYVERDFGPPRGRLLQVIVGGYSSALDVERDLRRIRELPGYSDSHVLIP